MVTTLASVVETDPLQPAVERRLAQMRNELDWMAEALAGHAGLPAADAPPTAATVRRAVVPGQTREKAAAALSTAPAVAAAVAPAAAPAVAPAPVPAPVPAWEAAASPVEVGAVAAELWESTVPGSRCSLRLVREGWGLARVDRSELRRSVRNLLDNALRAAGDGGQVELRVTASAGTVTVEVADSGPGFGRVPTQQGLGLLTVRRFAADSGGRLTTGGCARLGGALLRLELPLTTEAGS